MSKKPKLLGSANNSHTTPKRRLCLGGGRHFLTAEKGIRGGVGNWSPIAPGILITAGARTASANIKEKLLGMGHPAAINQYNEVESGASNVICH